MAILKYINWHKFNPQTGQSAFPFSIAHAIFPNHTQKHVITYTNNYGSVYFLACTGCTGKWVE